MPWNNRIEQRRELVCAMRRRRNTVQEICGHFGVSRAFAYRLSRRCAEAGWRGLVPRPRGPQRWRQGQAKAYRQWIMRARRRHEPWSGWKLWQLLRTAHPRVVLPSIRTVERWLHRAGVTKRRPLRRRIQPQPLHQVRPARRPNDRWTFDWKGWMRTGDGRKVEPFTVRDDATGMLLWTRPLPDHRDVTVRRVCRRLFRIHGLPKAIRTDRGGPFCGTGPHGLTSLSAWWFDLGLAVEFVHRQARIHNNAHEQMHGIMQQELFRHPAATYQGQLARLRRWQREYNQLRPHARLDGLTPAQRYRSAPAALPKPSLATYPSTWKVRRVAHSGTIGLDGKIYYVSRAFAGFPVGCEPYDRGYRVYYRSLLLQILAPTLKVRTT